jgi:hypothetical protein
MKLTIEKASFKKISLDEICKALQKGLSNNFKEVIVSVVDCPNLKNWDCPAEGMSGNQKITDVGGEPYMHDKKYIGAEFDFKEVAKLIGSEKSYAFGAGSGAMSCLDGHCGELVINDNFITEESKSVIAMVGKNKECVAKDYTDRKHGGLGNIFYTDGKQGRVIKILIKGRSGEQGSLTQAIRSALLENLDLKGNDHLGLAGVFRVLKGKIKSHVQPDYVDIKHECYSVLWTGDPTGGNMNLRESSEHTHFHSYKNKQEAGHYHCDVTPDEIEYECYFNTADEIYRVNNIYKELASQS